MAVFMEPGELAQIRADYRKARWLMTEGRDNIVKAAVEWSEWCHHPDCENNPDMSNELINTLHDAVKAWKEAQA